METLNLQLTENESQSMKLGLFIDILANTYAIKAFLAEQHSSAGETTAEITNRINQEALKQKELICADLNRKYGK